MRPAAPPRLAAALSARLAPARERLAAWRMRAAQEWRRRTRREQALLRLAGILALVVLPWVLLVRPALDGIHQAQGRLAALRTDAAELQALILESQALRSLQRGRIDPAGVEQALAESLGRAGLAERARWQSTPPSQDLPGPHYVVELEGAGAAATLGWLDELSRVLSLRIVELDLRRSRRDGRELPDRVDGRVLLVQPAGEPLPAEGRP